MQPPAPTAHPQHGKTQTDVSLIGLPYQFRQVSPLQSVSYRFDKESLTAAALSEFPPPAIKDTYGGHITILFFGDAPAP